MEELNNDNKENNETSTLPPTKIEETHKNMVILADKDLDNRELTPQITSPVMKNIREPISPENVAKLINVATPNTKTPSLSFESFNNFIDKIIMIIFYSLILGTIVFAVWSVGLTIIEFFQKPHKDNIMLKVSEHIFLSLLPIFIVFGFFHYYKINIQETLTTNRFPRNDDGNSTKTMNLTKTLFLSSIISYVMIKVIELISSETDLNIWKILLSILFLIILMIYFVFVRHQD